MSIATATLSINAAFLAEIKEDNLRLRELLASARELSGSAAAVRHDGSRFSNLLDELRDQMAVHFSLEEAFGYFEDALEAAPRLSEQAEQLRNEHQPLYLELCDIAERIAEKTYRRNDCPIPRDVVRLFQEFDLKLQDHEKRENELILQALHDDIGVGD